MGEEILVNKNELLEDLRYVALIVEQYQMDIRNSEWTGVDLLEKGFCQGEVYKNALLHIAKILTKYGAE